MGDKARAKAEMRAAGVPLVPGTEGGGDARGGARGGERARLPGAAEGGRRRRRQGNAARARGPTSSRPRTRPRAREAEAAFSDGSLYVEKALVPARHVEIQVLCDSDGGVLTLGERECSIQRRHQKLIEESPSPALDARDARGDGGGGRARLPRRSATRTPAPSSSCSAPDGTFHFIELNARLQVEHPVSELVTGIDIVREQLRVAAGEQLALDRARAAPRARARGPAERRGSGARTSRLRRDGSRASGRRSAPASASTRISRRARRSRRTTTR